MEQLINGKEKSYFVISLIISVLLYLGLIISVVGIVYLIIGVFVGLIAHGLFIGQLRGNGVRVSEEQFPEVYYIAQDLAKKMNLDIVPAIYILHGDGIFNAFATRFLGRNFVVIYSDVLELAYEQGEPALSFVVCHELAHIKRKHLSRLWYLYPSMLIPFLGTAYSRACEYTCDSFGAYYVPEGAELGILTLAVGKKLYKRVDSKVLGAQASEERGFWVWFSEILSTHPYLPKRLNAIRNYDVVRYSIYNQSGNISS